MVWLIASSAGFATTVRFDFNAGHLLAPPQFLNTSKSSGNQKLIRQNINDANNNAAHTWSATTFNQYERWANGLGQGEGISSFNVFLRSDISMADTWGQMLRLKDWNSATGLGATATAGSGWTSRIVDMNTLSPGMTPGPSAWGFSIQWYTTDPTKRIRPGMDLPGFSFTAPVELYFTGGGTMEVADGNQYTVWFGTQNRASDNSDPSWIKPLEFDANWGTGVTSSFASTNDSVWNGSMNLYATVIPEPSTGSLLLVGAGLAWLHRRRST